MTNNTQLQVGTTYLTRDGIAVTPIKTLPNDKAIFVTDEFYPTPFVLWYYKVTPGTNTIELWSGEYYTTLENALADRDTTDTPGPTQLKLSFLCPICEEHIPPLTLDLTQPMTDIVAQVMDNTICNMCGMPSGAIHKIELDDGDTQLDLPLYRGPLV